jgi:hypothetical protein
LKRIFQSHFSKCKRETLGAMPILSSQIMIIIISH